MLRIRDELAGERITIYYVESKMDVAALRRFIRDNTALGIDTESTGLNPYRPKWNLRTVQCGNANESFVIPAQAMNTIRWLCEQDIKWIGHNGPHDIRCIDKHLGRKTGIICAETYIPSHHHDSRNREEGGIGHGLKELAMVHVDYAADKWERQLKAVFKAIEIPIPGMVYKSGPRRGQQKVRKAKLSEGWSLVDPKHPAYIAYAGVDPILTYRVWRHYQSVVRQFYDLYQFDRRVANACDRLQRRAIRLDVRYTEKLNSAYERKAAVYRSRAADYGCANIQSGQQIAETLTGLGVTLTARTPSGQFKTDGSVLRGLLSTIDDENVRGFVRSVLLAKQLEKRRQTYTEHMLSEMDSAGRVHPSINPLGARTTRMSVSNPALQQLPTKNRENEIE